MAPAPTVIVPPGRIPSVARDVAVVSTTVPVPVAGAAVELLVADELEPEAALVDPLDEEELELPDACSCCCTSAVIWLSTRFKALELAMLARPLPKFVSAELMALITESVAVVVLSFSSACCQ